MSSRFRAEEVLEIAEHIERNGAEFYRKAAALKKGTPHAEGLLRLAEMEAEHQRIFAAMRFDMSNAGSALAADPDGQADRYLDAIADAHPGEGAPSAAAALTGKEDPATILATAIELEKKSILFYLGLRDMVPPELGRAKVDTIIAEERTHVVTLRDELNAVAHENRD